MERGLAVANLSHLISRFLKEKPNDPPTGIYNGCLLSVPSWIMVILFTWITCSCAAKYPIITEHTGVVVNVMDTKTVEVMYNILNRDATIRALNIYYWPEGHGLKIGDPYPPCIAKP